MVFSSLPVLITVPPHKLRMHLTKDNDVHAPPASARQELSLQGAAAAAAAAHTQVQI